MRIRDALGMDQSVHPNLEFISIDDMNSVYQDLLSSSKPITAETIHDDDEDSDVDMDDTQFKSSCVSSVSEFTAEDFQWHMGVFMTQPNK